MPIESKIKPEGINIQNLALELPETKDGELDITKEISKEEWQIMQDKLEGFRKLKTWNKFCELGASMKVLNPNVEISLTAEEQKEIKDTVGIDRPNSSAHLVTPASYIETAINAKIINPRMEFNLGEQDWNLIQGCLQTTVNAKIWDGAAFYAVSEKFLYPHKDSGLRAENIEEIKKSIEYHQSQRNTASFTELAALFRILYPDTKYQLSRNEWQNIIELSLEPRRKSNDINNFSRFAMFMKIVAAPEIIVDEKGIHFPEEKNFSPNNTPKIPTTKRF